MGARLDFVIKNLLKFDEVMISQREAGGYYGIMWRRFGSRKGKEEPGGNVQCQDVAAGKKSGNAEKRIVGTRNNPKEKRGSQKGNRPHAPVCQARAPCGEKKYLSRHKEWNS